MKKRDMRPTELVDFQGIARHHHVNIMLYEPKKDKGKEQDLYGDSAEKRPAYNKHRTIGRPLVLH